MLIFLFSLIKNSGPDVVWVEGEKQLFRCQLVLDSTVATRDIHLHNLFSQAERLLTATSPPGTPSPPPWNDVCNSLKAAHAIKLSSLIGFLPTILNQLFEMMVSYWYWFFNFYISLSYNILVKILTNIYYWEPWDVFSLRSCN